MPVSRDMLGRVFNGSGKPIDGGCAPHCRAASSPMEPKVQLDFACGAWLVGCYGCGILLSHRLCTATRASPSHAPASRCRSCLVTLSRVPLVLQGTAATPECC